MTRAIAVLLIACATAWPVAAQDDDGLDPRALVAPLGAEWPTFNGDYSGRRYSALAHITDRNVKALSLAWVFPLPSNGGAPVKSTPLMIDGVLYFSTPDHAYAVDARTGRQIWHYVWPSKGGNHLGNRGLGALGTTLFLETPDCHLVALNLHDGSKKWDREICDMNRFYYASVAPVVIRNQVIAGVSGDDMDNPGYLQAHDPETGEMKWRWYAVPQHPGDPGADTWPNIETARHGGGMTWTPVTYDPVLNLIFVTTGNPQPVIAHANRAGANLFTGSIVALEADTGRMVWYFQSSPHDTHDWDSTQTAVVFDAPLGGRPRQLIAQAARNGHFFVLDRATGRAVVSSEFVPTNWASGYDAAGQPIPNPAKMPSGAGVLVSPNQGGATNWQSPSFSSRTGLFYVNASRAYSVYYLYDLSDNPAGWGGTDRGGYSETMLQALDYRTGKVRWTHPWTSGSITGLLSTAGNVLFTGGSGGLEALDASTGAPLWHSRIGQVTNAPTTFELDGLQYVVAASNATVYAFVLN